MSPRGDKLFVADFANRTIRCISLEGNNIVTTIAKPDGEPIEISNGFPRACALAPDGSLYVTSGHKIYNFTFQHYRAPIVIPPSTRDADFNRLVTDSNLPDGKIAFNVGFPGEPKKSTPAIGRGILSARSPYFANMFAEGRFQTQDVVDVDDCDFATFQAMLDYLTKDTVNFSHGGRRGARLRGAQARAQARPLPSGGAVHASSGRGRQAADARERGASAGGRAAPRRGGRRPHV